MKLSSYLLALLICSCGPANRTNSEPNFVKSLKDTLEEAHFDSAAIGVAGRNKISVKQFRNKENVYVEIELLQLQRTKWIQKQTLQFPKDLISICDPQIQDYNNDGYGDISFISSSAARMSNEVRKLLIFKPNDKTLILIKNSEDYPNLRFNASLNCIDSWMLYGGSSTLFLKIENDSLKEFAGVELFDKIRKVFVVDENGNHVEIRRDSIEDLDVYTRYKNYNPLIENWDE